MPKRIKILLGLLLFNLSHSALAAAPDPCEGTILNVFRRPTIISSACTTPYGKYTFESGVQYHEYSNKTFGYVFPQTKVRIGVPGRNEITLILPNEQTNTKTPSGLSPSQLTFKHEIYYNEHWNTAIRGIYLPASGSRHWGTAHNGFTVNGIVTYAINSQINASLMLGYASLSTPQAMGGKQFNTFSPDFALGWQAKSFLHLYAEVYGQTSSGPRLGPGYNMDTGLLYLFTKNLEADIEVGHRLSGHLGLVNVYYGTGFSVLF